MINKRILASLAVVFGGVAGMVAAAPKYSAVADPVGNFAGLKTEAGRIGYDFIDTWFNKLDPAGAFDKYVAREGFVEHAVYGATTATVNRNFQEEKDGAVKVMAMIGKPHFDIKQDIVQGEWVFMHIAVSQEPKPAESGSASSSGAPPPGAGPANGPVNDGIRGDHKGPREMIEILRVHNGKIVDHWDLHVATNSDSIVFEGLDRKLP